MVEQLGGTSSRLRKESILLHNKDLHGFKEVMQFIFDPYLHTGISDKKMSNGSTSRDIIITLSEALTYFKTHQTGSLADVAFAWSFVNCQSTRITRNLAYSIVTKNLKIGVTERTLNKIYGDTFIPVIGCNLGVDMAKVRSKMSGIYISSRKIDGARRLLVKENGNMMMYTRSGHVDEGLVDILAEAVHLPDNMVYDGELEAIGTFKDNIALRQATNSIANTKGRRTGLTYNIFDAVPVEDFKLGESKHNALARKRFIDVLFGLWPMEGVIPLPELTFIKAVPIEAVSANLSLHEKIFFRMIEAGEEGLMLIKADSLYKVGKRTNDWVKMKNYSEIFLPVVDIFEGAGKYEGMLGGVRVDYMGTRVGVGSGFTDHERLDYWNNPEKILQKVIRVVCQGESKDSTTNIVSLNCPIYKGIADPGDIGLAKFKPLEGV